MLSGEQVQIFQENGFLNFGPVLTENEVQDLRTALDRVLEGKSEKSPEAMRNLGADGEENVVIQIVNIWEAEDAFRKHLYHPKIVQMISQLTGSDTIRVWHDQIQIKPARVGGPTVWHQDHPYWPVIEPADLVSAWVAIEDATIENGCMSMVRRSHTWGPYKDGTIGNTPEHGPAADPAFLPAGERVEVVPCEVKGGSVVFHHCLTWHGAPPNRTESRRPAIAVHYMPGHTRYVPSKGHMVEHHITVQPGEILEGDHFPTVMRDGQVLPFA